MFRQLAEFSVDRQWAVILVVLVALLLLYLDPILERSLGFSLGLDYSAFLLWVMASCLYRLKAEVNIALGLVLLSSVPLVAGFGLGREPLIDRIATIAFLLLSLGCCVRLLSWVFCRSYGEVGENDF